MDNTIVLGLLGSLLILQVVGIYLLLIRKRFKVTNGKVDLENFLSKLDEDVAKGSNDIDKNVKDFIFNIQNHNKESKKLLVDVNKKTDNVVLKLENESKKNKDEIDSTVNGLVEALNNALSDVSKKSDEVIGNIQKDSLNSKKEIETTISNLSGVLKNILDSMNKDIEVMKDEVSALRKLTLEKDSKIQRYEEGYDQKNIKEFREELFRIIHFIEEKKKEDDSEALIEVHEDLGLLLEEVHIKKIPIEIGEKYEGKEKVAIVKKVKLTDSIEQDGLIATQVRNGYFIQTTEENIKVLRPAEIIVYKYEDNQEVEIKTDNEAIETVDTVNQPKEETSNKGKENE